MSGIKMLFVIIIVLAVVVALLALTTANGKHDASLSYIEQQRTEQLRLAEQTKSEAQQLRAEQTARTQNALTGMLGPIIGFGVIVLIVVFADHLLTRNRIVQSNEHYAIRLLEMKQLEIEQQRLAAQREVLLLENRGSAKRAQIVESWPEQTWPTTYDAPWPNEKEVRQDA
jgi:hypothetical protein